VLYEEPYGEPQKFSNGDIIKEIVKPKYFIKTGQQYDTGLKDRIKSNYLSNLAKPPRWTMKIAGDIIIGRTVYEQEMRRNDYTSSFALVKDFLKDADYTVADAEWTAADGIAHPLQGLSFSSPAKSLDGLTYAGIDAVSLANNHSMNGGVTAFEQMLNNLTERKIGYFGAGRNFEQAHAPYITDIKGVKVAFLGYTAIPGNYEAGPNTTGNAFVKIGPWYPFNEEYVAQVENDIKLAKTKADVVIPYFHWSQEYVHEPNEQMRILAHRSVDAGATMVVGSHPHWVQGIEWYKGSLVAYSLGNFVFDQEQSLKTKQGVVLNAQFSGGKLVNAHLVPIQIEQYFQPHLLDGAGAMQVLQNIFSSSRWIN
jgi:poly-gamma-glutamate capsule biosynthesis protein CapA/YwtB (metallophosphatase superfamily)